MPTALSCMAVMLAVICIWFLLFRRPVYEGVLLSLLVLLTVTDTWGSAGVFLKEGMNTGMLYSMAAFIAMSQLLTHTGILDDCVEIILALLGRTSGGAGYVAVVAGAFMGAFSGSGPANVMAVGPITIPVMKRSGYPPELAANIQSASSCLGNTIPPSTNIIGALGAFAALYPDSDMTIGRFWLVMWGVSAYFILQRLVTVAVFCRVHKIRPLPPGEIPDLREALKKGWKGILLPAVILLPFLIDALFNSTLFARRLGETGARYFSSSVVLFTAGLASVYAVFITRERGHRNIRELAGVFADGVKELAPTVGVCCFGYIIGALFAALGVTEQMGEYIGRFHMGKLGLCAAIALVSCVLSMVIPGSSLTVMFGPLFITMLAAVGVEPLLAAAMLPAVCGTMCNLTPPFALSMYAAMGIAGSDFAKTVKNDLWWVALQFGMEIVLLMGWLPVPGVR